MLLHLAIAGSLAFSAATPASPTPEPDSLGAAAHLRPSALPASLLRTSRTPFGTFARPDRPVVVPDVSAIYGPGRVAPLRPVSEPVFEPTPQMVEYSDGYFTRLTIHKWASWAMLPLFISEYAVGQKLIHGDESMRGPHGAITGGIGALFAVNTVTGGWNMIEGWQDPYGRTRRTLHSALMLLADAGFLVTASLAHESEGGPVSSTPNTNHRTAALISMSTATVGWLMMLPIFGGG